MHVLQIREEIKQFGINIYQFPECDSDEDEDFKKQDQILKVLIPSFLRVEMCRLLRVETDRFIAFASLCRTASRLQ